MQTSSPKPRRRAAVNLLSRELIIDTALDLVAHDKLDSVSIRDVAAALETGPSSLYVWVPNRMTLHHLMLQRVLENVRLPRPDPGTWQRQLVSLAVSVYRRLNKYPGLAKVMLGFVPLDPSSLRITEGYLDLLGAGGVPDSVAVFAVDSVILYIAASSFERSVLPTDDGPFTAEAMTTYFQDHSSTTRQLELLDSSRYPNVHRLAKDFSGGSSDQRFIFGIESFVAGIARTSGVM